MNPITSALLQTIEEATRLYKCNEILYEYSCNFSPSHQISINNILLHYTFDLPSGYDHSHLDRLVQKGYLEKVFESPKDSETKRFNVKYIYKPSSL